MNHNLQAAWCSALRSKKYVQGYGDLRREGKHCPLGVLCDVFADGARWRNDDSYDGHFGFPPGYILSYLSEDGRHQSGFSKALEIQNLNDGDKRPFSQIATYIEANL